MKKSLNQQPEFTEPQNGDEECNRKQQREKKTEKNVAKEKQTETKCRSKYLSQKIKRKKRKVVRDREEPFYLHRQKKTVKKN